MKPIVVRVDAEIVDLVPKFLANRQRDVESLRKALGCAETEAVRRLGHTLKGVGGGYGFPAISEFGARIEDAALAGDLAAASAVTAELGDYLARIKVEVD